MNLPAENKRVKEIIEYYCDGNENQFSKEIKISQPRINRLFSMDSRSGKFPLLSFEIAQAIINKFINVNPEWLMVGQGSMFKKDMPICVNNLSETSKRKTKDPVYEIQRVPLFNLEATMGLIPLLNGDGIDEEKVIDYISIPSMSSCDGAIYASGDSMYPLLKSGDIIAYKRIAVDRSQIFFGEMYIIAVKLDEFSTMKTIKFVHQSELGDEYVRLVSHNQHHSPKDVKISQIASIGLVRASIRLHN
jgi:phage repressor protein C with HTH and peptisase S24 domain